MAIRMVESADQPMGKALEMSLISRDGACVLVTSWDALGASAVWGYPYGALRVSRAVVAGARVDITLVHGVELGLRASLLRSDLGFDYGEAAQLSVELAGVLLSGGVAVPKAHLDEALIFASANAATFL